MQKLISILELEPQRREISDLAFISSFIKTPEGPDYSLFIAFYAKLRLGSINLTHSLEIQTQLYILKGTLVTQKLHEKQKIKHIHPSRVIFLEGMKLTLDDNSIAISITKSQAKNCEALRESNLQKEVDFLRRVPYFSQVSKIVCMKIIHDAKIRRFQKGEKVRKISNSLYLVCDGEFQSYQIYQEEFDNKKTKYCTPLMRFGSGSFFNTSSNVRCVSGKGIIYCFDEEFAKNYLQVICGQKITLQAQKIQKYIQVKAKSVDFVKKKSLSFLMQTKFRPQQKYSLTPLSARSSSSIKFKSISSRNPQQVYNKYQQLDKLEEKKNRCIIYKQLFPLSLSTKGEILQRMYKSIKGDLQSRDKQKREAKKTLIF